ncbi:hypothetical protein JCM8097_006536 [Rhodosporidiobolus ruineniae]
MSDSDASVAPCGPAYFDRLPVELLKRVVHFVREQDRADDLDFSSFAGAPEEDPRTTDIARGIWPSEYTYGVRALSLVNRRFRELALPVVFKTLHPAALADAYFRFNVLASDSLRSHVIELDLSTPNGSYTGSDKDCVIASDNALVDIAWTLPFFPRVKSLVIPKDRSLNEDSVRLMSSGLPFFLSPEPAVWRPMGFDMSKEEKAQVDLRRAARTAWEGLLARVYHLRLHVAEMHSGALALSAQAIPATPKSLALDFPFFLFDTPTIGYVRSDTPAQFWLEGLSRFRNLEKLAFSFPERSSPPRPVHADYKIYHLPSLRTLTLTGDHFGADLFPFLDSFAPNLTHLCLDALEPDSQLPTYRAQLPHLRRLCLSGTADLVDCLRVFLDSPLEAVELEVWHDPDFDPHHYLRADFAVPSTLRELRFSCLTEMRPADEAFIAAWAEKGVLASVGWTPSLAAVQTNAKEFVSRAEQARAVGDDLAWAANRVEHLERIGDEAGLQEMAEATRRIRERRILEQQ